MIQYLFNNKEKLTSFRARCYIIAFLILLNCSILLMPVGRLMIDILNSFNVPLQIYSLGEFAFYFFFCSYCLFLVLTLVFSLLSVLFKNISNIANEKFSFEMFAEYLSQADILLYEFGKKSSFITQTFLEWLIALTLTLNIVDKSFLSSAIERFRNLPLSMVICVSIFSAAYLFASLYYFLLVIFTFD